MDKKYLIRTIGRKICKKHYWLVSDRSTRSGDNGEAFFRFLQGKKDICPVFVIQTDEDDYEKMKRIGKVVTPWSLKHKVLRCIADVVLCSHLHYFEENHRETPTVFLQHGVCENDISEYINPFCRDNFYVIASGENERRILSSEPHQIKAENIWVTGLARFDRLYNDDKKAIIISMTWQYELAGISNPKDEDFLESKYYKELECIMNSELIAQCAKKNGYQIFVKLHPMMNNFTHLIKCPEHVKIWEESYGKMFAECSLLVTDYSSIVFDFAMLEKPVIYFQTESNDDESKHVWNMGEYSYEKQGFGEVVHDFLSLEKLVCEYLNDECRLKEMYKERIKNFFAYMDHNNCERIYERTKQMLQDTK